MLLSISLFVADFVNNIILSMLTLKTIKNKDLCFYLKYLLIIIVVTLVSNMLIRESPQIAKTIIKLLMLSSLLNLISDNNFSKILIEVFMISIILVLLDCLYGLVYIGLLGLSPQEFQNSSANILLANSFIAIGCLLILSIKKIKNFIQNMANLYSSKDTLSLTGNVILCIAAVWVFVGRNTSGVTPIYDYIMNIIVIFAIITFIIGFFKEKSDKEGMKKQYDILFDYAKTYELEVVEKSKWQHEYENQLVIIKDKINPENKKAHQYIDNLLKNKPVDGNSQWLGKLSKFPDIGIKGLLCYKIGQMQSKGISVFVDISENLKIKKLHEEILEKNLQDISRILGVYIDNAADAAYESKKKYFIFEFTSEGDKLIFQISNTFVGNIDLQKIGTERFSTKGHGHGYGLSLVKDIIQNNILLSEEREINGIYYVQRLIVDVKK